MNPGPKDWMPGPKPHRLADGERARLQEIWHRAGDGQRVPAEDVAWVCGIAMALDRPAYDEFRFPLVVALVNPTVAEAFLMRWKNKELLRQRCEFREALRPGRHVIFSHTVTASIMEAILVVRPYIRLELPDDDLAIMALRRATVSFQMTDLRQDKTPMETIDIFTNDPLDDHLICPDGKVFRRLPYVFSLDRQKILMAGHPKTEVTHLGMTAKIGEVAEVYPELGFFVPDGTRLVMAIDVPDPVEGPVSLISGLVASRYSTK